MEFVCRRWERGNGQTLSGIREFNICRLDGRKATCDPSVDGYGLHSVRDGGFPAADEDQWEFIKRVIDDCDYYLLIIGGRYGSTTAEGISYTEKEYDYAIQRGMKVIAFLHEDPDSIPLSKSEQTPELRARLKAFREKVASGRLVKFWKSADQLPGLVSLSLSKTIKMHPAVGWIRADKVSTEDILTEINEVRKEGERLRSELQRYKEMAVVEVPGSGPA